MSIEPNDPLEQALQGLDWWPEPAPQLWKQAVRTAERKAAGGDTGGLTRVLRSPFAWLGVPVAAVIVAAMVTSMSQFSKQTYRCASPGAEESMDKGRTKFLASDRGDIDAEIHLNDVASIAVARRVTFQQASPPQAALAMSQPSSSDLPAPSDFSRGATDRHVIHKVAIDLQADDLRGVYLKVQTLVPNEAIGEYIEQSQIHNTDGQLSAYITLRVRPERLSTTMDALRSLGTVLREQSDATDVTAQVTDIEARLRNERRVEQELLTLLDKRKDSPLEEVLKLSNSLADVRGRIERLVADQQRIGHLVSLASIVVTLQPKPKADAPESAGSGYRFGERLAVAWKDGLTFLIDSLAALMRVIVGGLLWWIILIVGLVLLHRWYVRRTAS
jgi:hypothetical protein